MTAARITVEVDAQKRNAYKAYAATKGSSLKDFVLEALEEKVQRERSKTPNKETLQAMKDSENHNDLTTHETVEELFNDLGI